MYCKHCGFKVPEGSEFCDNCGHKIGSTDLMDKLGGFREDEITHAGEQPRKVNLFSDAPDARPAKPGKKKTMRPAASRSSNRGRSQTTVPKVGLGIIIFIIIVIINILEMLMD
jgi:hypothetical protein